MKRQRNIQQVKEHDKCPPDQTKEEEIRILPEKEFRIMIVKMIQKLESKMELQINRRQGLRRWQEMFNGSRRNKEESINYEQCNH